MLPPPQMYKANASPIAFSNSTPELLEKLNGAEAERGQGPSSSGSKPTSILVAHALQVGAGEGVEAGSPTPGPSLRPRPCRGLG